MKRFNPTIIAILALGFSGPSTRVSAQNTTCQLNSGSSATYIVLSASKISMFSLGKPREIKAALTLVTIEDKNQGLLGCSAVPTEVGALFHYRFKKNRKFTMMGMSTALDFVWLKGNKIIATRKNVPIGTSNISPKMRFDRVIELKPGTIKTFGIQKGDLLESVMTPPIVPTIAEPSNLPDFYQGITLDHRGVGESIYHRNLTMAAREANTILSNPDFYAELELCLSKTAEAAARQTQSLRDLMESGLLMQTHVAYTTAYRKGKRSDAVSKKCGPTTKNNVMFNMRSLENRTLSYLTGTIAHEAVHSASNNGGCYSDTHGGTSRFTYQVGSLACRFAAEKRGLDPIKTCQSLGQDCLR